MTIDLAGVLRDAWALAKRDRDVLIAVAGMFILVPQIAQAMFVSKPPDFPSLSADRAAIDAWLAAATAWGGQNDVRVLLFAAASIFGKLALFTLYLDRARPDVAGALARALRLSPRFVLLAVAVTIPVNVGLLLILPGVYLTGRLLLAGPSLVAERPLGVVAAVRRSLALTRRHGLALMALACVPLLAGDLLALPFLSLGDAADGAPMANPVAAALLDCGAGLGRTLGAVATVLVQVALYRRLSRGM